MNRIHVWEYSCNGLGVIYPALYDQRQYWGAFLERSSTSFDSDSYPHVDSTGTLRHANNVNLHLDY